MGKQFISAEQLLQDSYRLSVQIFESGFKPDFIVGLWRGGAPVGIIVHDFFQYFGTNADHIAIRTSYRGAETYDQMISDESSIRVHGTQYLLDNLDAEDNLLIVDDVYSTGLNIKAVLDRLQSKTRLNMPKEVRIAVPWYKPERNLTDRVPDYYVHETSDWLVLPHELNGLTEAEIKANKPIEV